MNIKDLVGKIIVDVKNNSNFQVVLFLNDQTKISFETREGYAVPLVVKASFWKEEEIKLS
jgi:hypothetical protein